MDSRFVSAFIVVIFIALNHVNARFEPSLMDNAGSYVEKSEEQTCSSCVEASNKAQQSLSDTDLFESIELLSTEACQMLPSNLKIKCLEKAGTYIYQTKFLLQDLFQEISLCKDGESCLDQPAFPAQDAILSLPNESFRPDDLEVCVECRKAIKTMFDGILSTRSKRKILGCLVDYCSESGRNEKQCKLSLNKYFPLVMFRIEELQPNDMCRMMSFCH